MMGRFLFTSRRQDDAGARPPEIRNPSARPLSPPATIAERCDSRVVGLFRSFFYLQVVHRHYQTLAETNRIASFPPSPIG
jgi:hypothetical protein